MPIYEYKCSDCNRRFEVFQRMSEAPLEECEVCQGKLKRLIGTGAGIIFKGSGFYCTDYRDDSYHAAAKKEKGESTDTSANTSDKKPDTAAKATEGQSQ